MIKIDDWPLVNLGDICTLDFGAAFKSSQFNPEGHGLPVVRIRDVNRGFSETYYEGDFESRYLVSNGDFLVGMDGNFSIAEWNGGRALLNQRVCRVGRETAKHVHPRYLFHFLPRALEKIHLKKSFVTVKHLSAKDLRELEIPLPPLAEQQRITKILDEILQTSKQISNKIRLLDEEEKSAYLSLFGSEPATTPTQDLAADHKGAMRTGPFGSQLKHEEFVNEGIAVLGLDNVVLNKFRWAEPRHITAEKYEKLKRYTVYPGDVLISIMGTTGRCVIIPDDIPTTINTKHICAITLDRTRMLPEFLRASFLWHPEIRQTLRQQTKGAIMAGLNMGIIKKLPLPVPDLPKQQKWVHATKALDTVREDLVKQQSLADELHSSLATRAFAGQL